MDDEKKDEAIELIRKVCKPRKQMIPPPGPPMLAAEESIIPVDVMVRLGRPIYSSWMWRSTIKSMEQTMSPLPRQMAHAYIVKGPDRGS